MLKQIIARALPKPLFLAARRLVHNRRARRFARLPKLTREEFSTLLRDELGVCAGRVVFVHSSANKLNLAFPPFSILPILQDHVGPEGTLLFPATQLNERPEAYLTRSDVFDVANDPTTMGLVNELARRRKDAIRSEHPTTSVVAIGKLARELVEAHADSPYPCGRESPYYKLVEQNGLIIGLGVSTENLTFMHTVEDVIGQRFPVETRPKTLYEGRVRRSDGSIRVVPTYVAHPRIRWRNIPRYMRCYVAPEICRDFTIHGMMFFTAEARPLFSRMEDLAGQGITIYSRLASRR